MENSITITGMNRPQYFMQALESLCRNDLNGWNIFIALEPSDQTPAFFEICRGLLRDVPHQIKVNETVLGIRKNPFCLLNKVFDLGYRANLYLEEDIIVSPDATKLADWYCVNRRPNWLALNLIAGPCGSGALLSNQNSPDCLFESNSFNSLGFVMTQDKWKECAEGVWMGEEGENTGHAVWRTRWGWDWSVYALVASSKHLRVVHPAFARATHIGDYGTYMSPQLNERFFGRLKINDRRNIDYKFYEHSELCHEIYSHSLAFEEITQGHIQLEGCATVANELKSLASNVTLAPILADIVALPAFQGRCETYQNREYVHFLYQTILCRGADREGMLMWTEALDIGRLSRVEVARSFVLSDEFQHAMSKKRSR